MSYYWECPDCTRHVAMTETSCPYCDKLDGIAEHYSNNPDWMRHHKEEMDMDREVDPPEAKGEGPCETSC